MTEKRLILTINIGKYLNKCPICAQPTDKDNDNYEKYVQNAKETFGVYSIPVCYDCWCYQVTCCDICYIPTEITYSTEMGSEILLKTTLNIESDEHDNICLKCLESTSH